MCSEKEKNGCDYCIDLVVVDDDEVTLEYIRRLCKTTEINYKCFNDSADAVRYLAVVRPKILIIDYLMPTHSGLEIFAIVQQKRKSIADKLYLCTSVEPPIQVLEAVKGFGANLLLKEKFSNREYIFDLIVKDR